MVYNIGTISHKYSGVFYEVSFAAFVLAIGFACYYSDLIAKGSRNPLTILSLMILYYGVILTDKRSFILIIPLVACLLLFLCEIKRVRVKFMVLTIVIFILCIFNYQSLSQLLINILSDGSNSVLQLSSREKYWSVFLNMFSSSPIIGCGLNSYDYYFNLAQIKSGYLDFAGAHNSYLQILSEMGFIGGAIYIFCIFKLVLKSTKCIFIYRALTNYNDKLYLVIIATFTLFVCLIYALSGNVFYQPQQLITFFVFGNIIMNQYNYLIRKCEVQSK